MPTRKINLTPELDQLVDVNVRSSQYANASEVLRSGLHALEADEREDQATLDALRTAIQAGFDSGVAAPGARERIFRTSP